MILAGNYPEMINSLVVCSTPIKSDEALASFTERIVSLAAEKDISGIIDVFGRRVYSEEMWKKYRDAVIMMNRDFSDDELSKLVILSKAMSRFDLTDNLNKIECPVFVVGSEGDKVVVVQSCVYLAEKLKCKIFMYDSSFGHAVYDEADDFPERCCNFIKGTE